MTRISRTVFASGLGALVLLAPAQAPAQAVQVVTALIQYVGLTAAFAEALDKLAGAAVATYTGGREITDDVVCRRQKQALADLAVELRDLEREKRNLRNTLSRWIHFPRRGEWRNVLVEAERVRLGLDRVERLIEARQDDFATDPDLSRAYVDVLVSFDAKGELIRTMTEEMAAIDWDWSGIEPWEMDPHVDALAGLEEELEIYIETIAQATDVIAENAGTPCGAVAG